MKYNILYKITFRKILKHTENISGKFWGFPQGILHTLKNSFN